MGSEETVADVVAEMRGGTCPHGDEACPDDGTEDGDEPRRDRNPGAHGAHGVEDVAGQAQVTAELREYTERQIKWLDMTKVHYRKLFTIADRIDEALERLRRHSDNQRKTLAGLQSAQKALKDERDEWRAVAEARGQTIDEQARENARLRELVQDMLRWMPCSGPCRTCERYRWPEGREFETRMRELGIEV